MEVKFHEIHEIEDSLLKYAVIVSRYRVKWIFCKNKTASGSFQADIERKTSQSLIQQKRELFEETGAVKFEMKPICAYSINSYGLLFYADTTELIALPELEIERIDFFQNLPDELSFPLFHPKHFNKVKEALRI